MLFGRVSHRLFFRLAVASELALLILVCSFVLPSWATEADSGMSVKFVARSTQLTDLSAPLSPAGHAFMVISVKTTSGVKEEILGFYPTEKGLVVKGPGMLKAEYRCGPNDDCGAQNRLKLLKQLSKSEDSVTIPISDEQRRALYAEANKWDSKSFVKGDKQIVPSSDREYQLFNQSCIDFIAGAVEAIGYFPPPRAPGQTPVLYLQQLLAVEQEMKFREASRKAKEAELERDEVRRQLEESEKLAAELEQRAEEAEQRAEEAEKKAEKLTIPAGWVRCTCPGAHMGLGRLSNGSLYHPEGHKCP